MIETAQAFIERAGGAVDLVIANAGTGGPDALKSGDPAPLTEVMSINVNGMINTLLPFVPSMRQRGSGHLVAIASVAGYRALPWRATYSASKIAMRTLMEGWGWCLDRYKIDTTCINPGFIVSELTDKNEFDMPFILQTDDACRRIRRAIAKRKRVYTFPLPMAILSRLLTVIPGWLLQRLPLG